MGVRKVPVHGGSTVCPEVLFVTTTLSPSLVTPVPKPLVELHIKLLRKLGKSVTTDRWEKYLAKVRAPPPWALVPDT